MRSLQGKLDKAGRPSSAQLFIGKQDVYPGSAMRDLLAAEFRHMLCETLTIMSPDGAPGLGFVPFEHQAAWWAASDGKELLGLGHDPEEILKAWEKAGNVRYHDLPSYINFEGAEYWRIQHATPDGLDTYYRYHRVAPRVDGAARVLWQIGAFKSGKSAPAAIWMASFGIVPMLDWDLIGMTYDTSSPEFEYMEQFLLSSAGVGIKAQRHVNNPKSGDIQIKLENGAKFTVRSYDRAEGLEGKEKDGYTFTEAYQLPGLQVFDNIAQNLDRRDGLALFPTTPKRPWVGAAAKLVASGDPAFKKWFVIADIPRRANPAAYSAEREAQARQTMTAETFAFSWDGKLGQYVGQVYDYRAGQQVFTPNTHPDMWRDKNGPATVENLALPAHWEISSGTDTGTFRAAVVCAIDHNGDVYVLQEICNYRYVGTSIEELRELTIEEFFKEARRCAMRVKGRPEFLADHNSQFKGAARDHGCRLMKGVKDPELRTDLLRSLVQRRKVFFAPWLTMLPKEIEEAEWPKEASSATGRMRRIKRNDHLLDSLEHVGAKHVQAKNPPPPKKMTTLELMRYRHGSVSRVGGFNPWTGSRS